MNCSKNTIMIVIVAILIPVSVIGQKLDSKLRKAAKKGEIEKVQTLLKEGAAINSADKNGRTALMFASEKSHINVIRILLENGADIKATDNKNQSALDKAKRKNKTEVVKALEHGLEFTQVRQENRIETYEEFLSKHPHGPYSNKVKLILEQFSPLNILVDIATQFEKKSHIFSDQEISSVITQIDSLCNSELKLLQSENLDAITAKYEKLTPLEKLVEYGADKESFYLIIALNEIAFRLTTKVQDRMRSLIDGVGWDQLKPRLEPYVQSQQEMNKIKTELLERILLTLGLLDNRNTKRRSLLAIDRIFNEINIKASEAGQVSLHGLPSIINAKPSEIIDILESYKEKEQDNDLKPLYSSTIVKIQNELNE